MTPPFGYRAGALMAEEVAVSAIAEAVGTPLYLYSTAAIVEAYRAFVAAFAGLDVEVHYSLKANSNLAVVATLAAEGAGCDVVSEGELRRALAAGVGPERIVFSGVGKSAGELAFALETGICQFNVESEPELERLSELAAARGLVAAVALRINPEVDARTHHKITTGKRENKFGIAWGRARAVYRRAAALPGIRAVGLDVHIGSQLTGLAPFENAFARLAELTASLRADGLAVERLDLGGGLGIAYEAAAEPPPLADYAEIVRRTVGGLGCRLMFEPGRLLVGNAGLLVSRVLYVKDGEDRRFVILDAAMNDLLRPALYDAVHEVLPLAEPAPEAPRGPVDFVGPVCESGDTLARDRPSPPLAAADLVAIRSAGAYAAVMASNYNTRLLAPEVLVKGAEFAVVRRRQSYEELLAPEQAPPWLALGDREKARGAA